MDIKLDTTLSSVCDSSMVELNEARKIRHI